MKAEANTLTLDSARAVKILTNLSGSARIMAELTGKSYATINNIVSRGQGKTKFIWEFYRNIPEDFLAVLQDAWSILDALREMGVITPTPITDMTPFEETVYTLKTEGKNKIITTEQEDQAQGTRLPEEEIQVPASTPAPGSNAALRFRGVSDPLEQTQRDQAPISSLDSKRKTAYTADILDDILAPEQPEPGNMTGDIMQLVTTGGKSNASPITDQFESGFRMDIPDKYDSDNKRW